MASGVPDSVMLDVAYFAGHTAAEQGAVVTDLHGPVLTIAGRLGCRPGGPAFASPILGRWRTWSGRPRILRIICTFGLPRG